ncbi:MAG TPA: arylesterase [Steroidobacteraceae bacterium]|nr:arylesterase [Steroidobacteraceae bacterium]
MSRSIVILVCLWLAWPVAPARDASGQQPVILVYGDSLSAGYGVAVDKGWVSLLANRVQHEGYGFQVVNASVSGETTTGGLARLPHALAAHAPAIVIVELGANDGLRGLPLDTTRANLEAMMSLAAARHRTVVLAGMRMPPNYGERYTLGFAAVFPALARLHHAALVPFLLEGVADRPALMQADGLHPNEHGQAVVLDNVWPVLRPLLQKRQL